MSDRRPVVPADVGAGFPDRLLALEGELGGFVRSLTRGRANGAEPQDLVQETLARALRFQDRYDQERPLWPWLKRIAFRVYLDGRRRPTQQGLEQAGEPAAPDPPDGWADREELERHLRPLKEDERQVLWRFHHEGESIEEVARHMGMPAGTVKSLLHRARRKVARWHGGES